MLQYEVSIHYNCRTQSLAKLQLVQLSCLKAVI